MPFCVGDDAQSDILGCNNGVLHATQAFRLLSSASSLPQLAHVNVILLLSIVEEDIILAIVIMLIGAVLWNY